MFARKIFAVIVSILLPISAYAAEVTIDSAQEFNALDGSAVDSDGAVNGTLTIGTALTPTSLTLKSNGSINCNDSAPKADNADACPMNIVVYGNFILQSDSGIYAENRRGSGSGALVNLTSYGSFLMEGGSNLSAARTSGYEGGIAGNVVINSAGDLTVDKGATISAVNARTNAGNIDIRAKGKIKIDGILSVGPNASPSSYAARISYDKYVLQLAQDNPDLLPVSTKQQGGRITIISESTQTPALLIDTNAVLVSQGQDPSSDRIILEGCKVIINGLVASLSHKSNGAFDTAAGPGNRPLVVIRGGSGGVEINGQDLGSDPAVFSRQGRIRADYTIGEKPLENRVEILSRGDIKLNGPTSGDIWAISTFGGNAATQKGGKVSATCSEGRVLVTGRAAMASVGGIGGKAGSIIFQALQRVDISDARLESKAPLANNASAGGTISARSVSEDVLSNDSSIADVQGFAAGKLALTACSGTGFPAGTALPNNSVVTKSASCAAVTLPDEFNTLPSNCSGGECQGSEQECNPGCVGGEELVGEICVPVCPAGQVRNPITLVCEEPRCPEGQLRNAITGLCETPLCPDGSPIPPSGICTQSECLPGQVKDICNVCDGDGLSCVGCENKDISKLEVALDSTAHEQRNEILRAARRLVKISKNKEKKRAASYIQQADKLYMSAWELVYQIPAVIQTQCKQAEKFCVEVSTSPAVTSFVERVTKLDALARTVIKRLEKYKNAKKDTKARLKKVSSLFKANLTNAALIPASSSVCVYARGESSEAAGSDTIDVPGLGIE